MQNTEDRFILPSCRPVGSNELPSLPRVVHYVDFTLYLSCRQRHSQGLCLSFSSLVKGNGKIVLKNKIWSIIIIYSLDECLHG